MVMQDASDAVNASAACQSAGVSALFTPAVQVEGEDPYGHPGYLTLDAPGLTGGQLVGSIAAAAGQASGLCFDLGNLGLPASDQIRTMRVRIHTPPQGAQGGTITLTEHSSLGDCALTVPTTAGQTSLDIVSNLAAGFQMPEFPPGSPQCPSGHNPRDARQDGDSLVMALASAITICVNDPGVGMNAGPADICFTNADCDDGNPCTIDTCLAANGQCQHAPAPDGGPCDDADACTAGNSCIAGTCGTPLSCDDGNPCTTDTCDPATGACLPTPVLCDDANPCTADFCNPDTAQCMFVPLSGLECDDGDLCTFRDTCVQNAGDPLPTCQGAPACDDGNLCTDDACDPATGECRITPVQCDDGNSCTVDFCDATGTCVSLAGGPGGGGTCDDGNPCTTGDTCVPDASGSPVCVGQPLACDDDNACTADACDPATGGCFHTATPIGDVLGLTLTDNTTMTWSSMPGAIYWNTYRGTIPENMLGSRTLPTGSPYDQTCFEQADSHGDGALVSTDAAIPPLGTGYYYLVSEFAGCGEGPIGHDTNNTVIPNTSPCLVP
jgi:hypothetical protein